MPPTPLFPLKKLPERVLQCSFLFLYTFEHLMVLFQIFSRFKTQPSLRVLVHAAVKFAQILPGTGHFWFFLKGRKESFKRFGRLSGGNVGIRLHYVYHMAVLQAFLVYRGKFLGRLKRPFLGIILKVVYKYA